MKFLKINKIIALILTIVFLNSDVLADAKTFITNLTSDASKVLASEESKDQKMLKLINLAEENVDIDGIGRYTLGKYRKQLSDAKLDEYKSLFREYFFKKFFK